jgi:hypothetical protein
MLKHGCWFFPTCEPPVDLATCCRWHSPVSKSSDYWYDQPQYKFALDGASTSMIYPVQSWDSFAI